MEGLTQFLREQSPDGLLPWASQAKAAERFGVSYARVEEAALRLRLLPSRYQRNQQTLSVDDQLKLFLSRVAIIGCGGLGGYVIEELARLGVGTMAAIDPDVFEEHNLNRQLLATLGLVGSAKVQAAAARVAEINPAVKFIPIQSVWLPEDGNELVADATVVVDALDSITTRLALAATCSDLGIPLVHGAIAGWYGQVTTQFPGDNSIQRLYGGTRSRGIEQQLGNPAFTPALVASMQSAEVCKIILGVGNTLRNRVVFADLRDMTFSEMALAGQTKYKLLRMLRPHSSYVRTARMTKDRFVRIYFLPDHVEPSGLIGSTAIVIDLLRALPRSFMRSGMVQRRSYRSLLSKRPNLLLHLLKSGCCSLVNVMESK